jgi:hypothetical protein
MGSSGRIGAQMGLGAEYIESVERLFNDYFLNLDKRVGFYSRQLNLTQYCEFFHISLIFVILLNLN